MDIFTTHKFFVVVACSFEITWEKMPNEKINVEGEQKSQQQHKNTGKEAK